MEEPTFLEQAQTPEDFVAELAAERSEKASRERTLKMAVARLQAHHAQLDFKIDKLTWQVRDTCVRAEQAEAERDRLRYDCRVMSDAIADQNEIIVRQRAEIERLKRVSFGEEVALPFRAFVGINLQAAA